MWRSPGHFLLTARYKVPSLSHEHRAAVVIGEIGETLRAKQRIKEKRDKETGGIDRRERCQPQGSIKR